MGINSSVYNPNIFKSSNICPDWSRRVEIFSLPYTAPDNGWIIAYITRPQNGNYTGGLDIQGAGVTWTISNLNTASGSGSCQIAVNKGDVVTPWGEVKLEVLRFIPFNKEQ